MGGYRGRGRCASGRRAANQTVKRKENLIQISKKKQQTGELIEQIKKTEHSQPFIVGVKML